MVWKLCCMANLLFTYWLVLESGFILISQWDALLDLLMARSMIWFSFLSSNWPAFYWEVPMSRISRSFQVLINLLDFQNNAKVSLHSYMPKSCICTSWRSHVSDKEHNIFRKSLGSHLLFYSMLLEWRISFKLLVTWLRI